MGIWETIEKLIKLVRYDNSHIRLVDAYCLRQRDMRREGERVRQLLYLLDKFVWQISEVDRTPKLTGENIYPGDRPGLEAAIESGFPNLFIYNIAIPMTKYDEGSRIFVGNPIDDLSRIIWSLEEAYWLYMNEAEVVATSFLLEDYNDRLREDVRCLQFYIHRLEFEDDHR